MRKKALFCAVAAIIAYAMVAECMAAPAKLTSESVDFVCVSTETGNTQDALANWQVNLLKASEIPVDSINAANSALSKNLFGDVNGDGAVNSIDTNIIKRVLIGGVRDNLAVDIDGDGRITTRDSYILKLVADAAQREMTVDPTIISDTVTAGAGDTVEVSVRIKNNPGIAAAILSVSYNTEALSLTSVAYGDGFSSGGEEPNIGMQPVSLVWSATEEQNRDGTLTILTFKVGENIKLGSVIPVKITYRNGDICDLNENNVAFAVDIGRVIIVK